MLLYWLVTCLCFVVVLKFSYLRSPASWVPEMRSVLPSGSLNVSLNWLFFRLIRRNFLLSSCSHLFKYTSQRMPAPSMRIMGTQSKPDGSSVLDLPDLALENILERLSPASLSSMACVCSSLRERCISNHFWEVHMKQKWGRIIGKAARKEWQWHVDSKKNIGSSKQEKQTGLMSFLSVVWSSLFRRPMVDIQRSKIDTGPVSGDSIMSWYLALETGKFWFPAQVYNRENGHLGFMLSCYDAELSYDCRTDTFLARYAPHGRRAISMEHNIPWERLRAPPVDTSPHNLHFTDCLHELKPGDHIEIQWRRNKEYPYGWWYGVVGHLESCDGNTSYCLCQNSDNVVLDFNQYSLGSRWRSTTINRKDHGEEGNESDGFYGGIRKLQSQEEISTWRRLWPADILE